jgi:hypothetical protein
MAKPANPARTRLSGALALEIDPAALAGLEEEALSAVLGAAKTSITDGSKWLEKQFEDITRRAAPGRLHRAWASKVYPKGQALAYSPSAEIFVNGGKRSKGALIYWSTPGQNRASRGQHLAIPTDAAKATGGSKGQVTPRQWEAQNGTKLRAVVRPGKATLLVADLMTTGGSRSFTEGFKSGVAAARQRGGQQVRRGFKVMFVLIPFQQHANRASLMPAVAAAKGMLPVAFSQDAARRLAARGLR